MSWIWMAQLALDVALIFTIMSLLKPDRRRATEDASDERITAALNVLETRALQLEKDIQQYRKTIDEQLAGLLGLCDQARQIIDRNQTRVTSFTPSWEEEELKGTRLVAPPSSAAESAAVEPKIPTLQELEQTRQRHREEVALDLKTILRDQLA